MNGQGSRSNEPEPVRVGFRFPKTALAAVMLLAACTAAHQPRYGDIAATVPPMSADRARLYFYRDYEPYESLTRPYIFLNGQASAVSEPGGVLYRDVPPGNYLVAVDSYGLYPHQAKTVAVKGGETYYIKIESLRTWASGGGDNDYERDTFVAVLVDPEGARQEMSDLKFLGSP
jgi:hypothetical protein